MAYALIITDKFPRMEIVRIKNAVQYHRFKNELPRQLIEDDELGKKLQEELETLVKMKEQKDQETIDWFWNQLRNNQNLDILASGGTLNNNWI